MQKYTFYWLDGSREILEGNSVPHAFVRAGYGAGAMAALDFTVLGEDNSYEWINSKWIKKSSGENHGDAK